MYSLCLKLNLLIAGLLGFINFIPIQKSSKWVRFFLILYYNTYFVTILSFFLMYLIKAPSINVEDFDIDSSNNNITQLLYIICISLYHLWNITYIVLPLNLRITFPFNFNLLKKLIKYQKMKSKTANKDYGIFIFNFGIKVFYFMCFALLKEDYDIDYSIGTLVDFVLSFNAASNNFNLTDTLFCLVLYISTFIDALEKKILKLSNQDNINNKNLLWDSIRKKVISLKEITEKVYSRIQFAVCVLSVFNFIFIFTFVMKLATESDGEYKKMLKYLLNFIYVFIFLFLMDLPHKKVC